MEHISADQFNTMVRRREIRLGGSLAAVGKNNYKEADVWKLYNLPPPIREFRFHDTRKWRIDIAWPEYRVAVEIEGGVFTQGRHTRGGGFTKDMEKYNALAEAGWLLLRYPPKKIEYRQVLRALIKRNYCPGSKVL